MQIFLLTCLKGNLEVIKKQLILQRVLCGKRPLIVDLPLGCKHLCSKWVLKRKTKVHESVEKYKARLMIKGYKQTEDVDYFDTYSPITRINSTRMMLEIAASRNL